MALTKAKKKRTGEFKHRLTFQNWDESGGDGMGGSEGAWADEATLWGRVRPISGRELIKLDAVNSNISHVIKIRYSAHDITGKTRIKWGTRTFNIQYVMNEDEESAYMEIAATEEP